MKNGRKIHRIWMHGTFTHGTLFDGTFTHGTLFDGTLVDKTRSNSHFGGAPNQATIKAIKVDSWN